MKNYNYDLAKKIVELFEDLDVLESAYMGMHEDWFWTAQEIWSEGEWKVDLLSNKEADKMSSEFEKARENGLSRFLNKKNENGLPKFNSEYDKFQACMLKGIRGSDWATPVIEVTFKDGTGKTFNCFDGESKESVKSFLNKIKQGVDCTSGFLSGLVQESREEIIIENFRG